MVVSLSVAGIAAVALPRVNIPWLHFVLCLIAAIGLVLLVVGGVAWIVSAMVRDTPSRSE
jgi:hypothetical protein